MTCWIFQGNPTIFRLDEYLRTRKLITWTIRQKHFKNDVAIGDEVYIWRADGNRPKSGGIVAKGIILSSPQYMEDDAPELWIKPSESSVALRVIIKLEDVRLTDKEGMLKRIDLEKDPKLKDMHILLFRSQTNYKLKPSHAKYIQQLWEKKKINKN